MRGLTKGALAALLIGLAACGRESSPVEPVPTAPGAAEAARKVTCEVQVAERTVRCGEPGAARTLAYLTIGGQGRYVELLSSNVTVASNTFSFNLRVRNLTAQILGVDGNGNVDAAGVRVFFLNTSPAITVTGGTGSVSVANADGTATFTAPGQSYYQFNGGVGPFDSTASKSVQFTLNTASTVTSFSFDVAVSAAAPNEAGVLRWQGAGTHVLGALNGIWCASASDCFVVGRAGNVQRWNGSAWSPMVSNTIFDLYDVWGTAADNVYAVGAGGTIIRFDGTRWRRIASGTTVLLRSIHGRSASDIVVGGQREIGTNGLVIRFNGTSWTKTYLDEINTDGDDVWMASNGDAFAVSAQAGHIGRSVGGGAWTTLQAGTVGPEAFNTVTGLSTSNVFALGENGLVVRWNGTTADSTYVSGPPVFRASSAVDASNVFAITSDALYRFNGTSWSVATALPSLGTEVGVFARTATEVYITGETGVVLRWNGSALTTLLGAAGTAYGAVWAAAPDNIYVAGGSLSSNRRWNGSTWLADTAGFSGLTPAGVTRVGTRWFVVGGGVARTRSGESGSWSAVTGTGLSGATGVAPFDTDSALAVGSDGSIARVRSGSIVTDGAGLSGFQFNAVSAAGGGVFFAVGDGNRVYRRAANGTWSQLTVPSGTPNLRAVFASSADLAYVGGASGTFYTCTATACSATTLPGITSVVRGIWGTGNVVYVVTQGSELLQRVGSGAWTEMISASSGVEYAAVHGSSASHVVVVGDGGSILVGSR
ncbi:MAG: hypothetical protein NW201_09635 [Gemmatimonadales bacterium]|nr:hypothetical protein [Gemmatimonadales bacterium]